MVRTVTPSQLEAIVSFTFERQAKLSHVDDFKRHLIALPQIRHSVELEGASNFLVEAQLPNLAAFHDFMATHVDPNRRLISHFETSFVSRHILRDEGEEHVVWLHCNGAMRRVELDHAQWVASEGDYVRISIDGDSVLIHATQHSIRERLESLPFVQIHRSTLVNLDAVKRLYCEGRRWFAELSDGSVHRIAKGRSAEIGRLLESRSDPLGSDSSTLGQLGGPVHPIDRKRDACRLAQ